MRFKHSGNSGDIIYSLPSIKSLTKDAELFIELDVPMQLYAGAFHPNNGVRMTKEMFDMLAPLLMLQPYIKSVKIWNGEEVDYDLDGFRYIPMNLGQGNISRWYFNITKKLPDLSRKWLKTGDYLTETPPVIIARSERYQNPNIRFNFLNDYDCGFLGTQREYLLMKAKIPNLKWVKVMDFLELAEVINYSSLFIGNQSFPYSVAEGLKVNRILEPCLFAGNVIPAGGNCIEVYNQEQFEYWVKELIK